MEMFHGQWDAAATATVAFGAAFLAGMVNSIAGGGTLISFPALISVGLAPVTANATSTVAIWPGTVGSIWGYRRELRALEPRLLAFAIPALVGGIAGALLLRVTPGAIFARLVPFLILFATLLFLMQEPIQRRMGKRHSAGPRSGAWFAGAMLFQLLVGIYGGYFGAGIGILTLASLGLLGIEDINQMNGLKNFLGFCTNGVAAVYFIWAGMVVWTYVLIMAAGAIAGGYGGAGLARRLSRRVVRGIVIAIGFTMSVLLFVKAF